MSIPKSQYFQIVTRLCFMEIYCIENLLAYLHWSTVLLGIRAESIKMVLECYD